MTATAQTPGNLTPDEVRALLASRRPGEVALLDVRQDWEYAEDHLPGATHIPLPELSLRLAEVPGQGPLVVYCASGRRSLAAATVLSGQGRPEVFNMQGGIGAWNGASAVGDAGTGAALLAGETSPRRILAVALAMEKNLGAFYRRLSQTAADKPLAELLARLAGFEDKHMNMVRHLFAALYPGESEALDPAALDTEVLEGGRGGSDVLEQTPGLDSAFAVLEMAMGIEAQAQDLYMRLAALTADAPAKEAFLSLAREEQGHLTALGNLLDKIA